MTSDAKNAGMDPIGDRLRRARLDRGWTLDRTAEVAAVTTSWLSLVERGLRKPGAERLARLVDVLDLSMDLVLTGQPPTQPPTEPPNEAPTPKAPPGPSAAATSPPARHHASTDQPTPPPQQPRHRGPGATSDANIPETARMRGPGGGIVGRTGKKTDFDAPDHAQHVETIDKINRKPITILPELLETIGRMDLDHQRWLLKILKYNHSQ